MLHASDDPPPCGEHIDAPAERFPENAPFIGAAAEQGLFGGDVES
jgi:hypothetical protein